MELLDRQIIRYEQNKEANINMSSRANDVKIIEYLKDVKDVLRTMN